jgi:hypothetical protein
MRYRYRRRDLLVFVERMKRGLHIEYRETVEIPTLIKQRQYKKAGAQVYDIVKMSGLVVLWVLPGGAVITAAILKSSGHFRPSAFQEKKKEVSKCSTSSKTANE